MVRFTRSFLALSINFSAFCIQYLYEYIFDFAYQVRRAVFRPASWRHSVLLFTEISLQVENMILLYKLQCFTRI